MSSGRGSAPLDPVQGILAVLDRGRATGTNKLSLLLALMELAPTAGPDGVVPLTAVAEKMVEIHWEHVRPFAAPELGPGAHVLSQVASSNRESTVIQEVARLHGLLPQPRQSAPFWLARTLIPPQDWTRAVGRVRRDARRNPVLKLQTLDRQPIHFLYAYDPDEDALLLLPQAVRDLIQYGPVLKELVHARFVREVMRANPGLGRSALEARLEDHFFGAERQMPHGSLRRELQSLQQNRCIYTGERLRRTNGSPVDHVIPWSRVRISALGNFVITSAAVNSSKSDLMLALDPLERWLDHVQHNRAQIEAIGAAHAWPEGTRQTIAVARRLYDGLGPGAALWSPDGARAASAEELADIDRLLGAA